MKKYIATARVDLGNADERGIAPEEAARAILDIETNALGGRYWTVDQIFTVIRDQIGTGAAVLFVIARTERDPAIGTHVMAGRGIAIFDEVDEAAQARITASFAAAND